MPAPWSLLSRCTHKYVTSLAFMLLFTVNGECNVFGLLLIYFLRQFYSHFLSWQDLAAAYAQFYADCLGCQLLRKYIVLVQERCHAGLRYQSILHELVSQFHKNRPTISNSCHTAELLEMVTTLMFLMPEARNFFQYLYYIS